MASLSHLQNANSGRQNVHSPINEWSARPNRTEMLFARPYLSGANSVQSSASNIRNTGSNPIPSFSSVVASSSASLNLAAVPPLVDEESSAESTRQSVATTAFQDQGVLVRDNGDDAFRRATSATNSPYFQCTFTFLKCTASFVDEGQWREHCLSHFQLKSPPKSVLCPYCTGFNETFDDPKAAWEARMNHIASHYRAGDSLACRNAEFPLIRYFWQKNIISSGDLKELEGNYYLQREPEAYLVTTHQKGRNERGTTRSRR